MLLINIFAHDITIMVLSHCSVENVVNKAVNKLDFSLVKPQQMMAIDTGKMCL